MKSAGTKILYLVHMLEDAAVRKRTQMLSAVGCRLWPMGFYRTETPVADIDGVPAQPLGNTGDGALASRIVKVVLALPKLVRLRSRLRDMDVVIARNLEMAVLGLFAISCLTRHASLVYECLDVHRIMLREDMVGRIMRAIEGAVLKRASLVIVSSDAFVTAHFKRRYRQLPPFLLVENKILDLDGQLTEAPRVAVELPARPWRIGWFGIIRCAKSLDMLDRLTRRLEGRLEVVIRGKPARHEFQDFGAIVAANPWLHFGGAYRNPDDLQTMYSDVHFTWAIDFFEEGANSDWLLPNRLYEGGYYASVPIALRRVETGRWLMRQDLGLVLGDEVEEELAAFLEADNADSNWLKLRQAMGDADRHLWLIGRAEADAVADRLNA